MDEEVKQEKAADEFEKAKREKEERDAEKTRRNREKREKKKRARNGKGAGNGVKNGDGAGEGAAKIQPRIRVDGPDETQDGQDANGGEKLTGTTGVSDGPGLLIRDDDD